MSRRIAALTALATTAFAATSLTVGNVAPARADSCAGAQVRTLIPSAGLTGWTENATFDSEHNLWVTRSLGNVVERYDRDGHRTASVPVESPGAVRMGPRGRLYVTSGNSTLNMIPLLPPSGTVVSFDPRAAQPGPTTFARGFPMPNGLAFDEKGFGYVADSGVGRGLTRIRPDGSIDRAWTAQAPATLRRVDLVNGIGINGTAVSGRYVYTTLTESLNGRVIRVPIDNPAAASVAADLTAPLPGFIDDLAVLDDGKHLVVTSTTGQVYVLAPATGARCAINAGVPVTAVAVDPAHPRRLVVTSELGSVLEITLN
jgi:sugar lactone lactonase YvrE